MASKYLIFMAIYVSCVSLSCQLKIPLSLLKKMAAITDPDVFTAELQNPIETGFDLNETDINLEDNNRTMIGGRPAGPETRNSQDIATNDPCSVRPTTVKIPQDDDPSVVLWPLCTKINRCGGCCQAVAYECTPIRTSMVYINVGVNSYPYDEAEKFDSVGTRIVPIVQHDECEAQCRVKSHHCSRYQRYNAETCECECVVLTVNCQTGTTWNPAKCRCVCNSIETCEDASLKYSPLTCKCELRQIISGAGSIDIDKVNTPKATNILDKPQKQTPKPKEDEVNKEVPVVVEIALKLDVKTTTTTTKTPAATTTSKERNCSNQICPFAFIAYVNRSGKCSCMPFLL